MSSFAWKLYTSCLKSFELNKIMYMYTFMHIHACVPVGRLLSLLPLVVGRCVWLGARSWRCADGSRPRAVHQTAPKACREWTPHCLYRRPLLLHNRHAGEEPAQVHWSHRGREIIPMHTLLETWKWTMVLGQSSPVAPSACGLILSLLFSLPQMFSMFPQQRKAVAKFANPDHAANFQMSFHR